MKYWKTGLAAAFLAAGTMSLTACAGGSGSLPDTVNVRNVENEVIRVTAREQVKVEPDMAEVVYSVYSQASDAQTCQTQNNTDLEKVLELLKGQGVEEKSIQTSNYGLEPIYDWREGKTITGYEMTTRVTVSDIPMEQVGALLSDSVEAGVNSIDSVTYLSSKYDEAYQEALTLAVSSAKTKAEALASAGGCKLGTIVNIDEAADYQSARYTNYNVRTAGKMMLEEAAADMGVMPGQLEVEADITVEFAIE